MKREELIERLKIRVDRWVEKEPDLPKERLLQKAALFCEDEGKDIPLEILAYIEDRKKYAETRESMMTRLQKVMKDALRKNPDVPEATIFWYMCMRCQGYGMDLPIETIIEVFRMGEDRETRYREQRERTLRECNS